MVRELWHLCECLLTKNFFTPDRKPHILNKRENMGKSQIEHIRNHDYELLEWNKPNTRETCTLVAKKHRCIICWHLSSHGIRQWGRSQ